MLSLSVAFGAAACTADDSATQRSGPSPSAETTAEEAEAEAPDLDVAEAAARGLVETYSEVVTGMIVLVRVGDETRVLTAGRADVGGDRTMKADERFPIASITKSMVATAVLRLVERGRLALDDTIDEWLPGLLPQGSRITIEQLLAHRGGLHEPEGLRSLAGLDDASYLALVARERLDFPPGTSGAYSNAGYTVLGLLLERVTGRGLGEVLQQEVFGPARMEDTSLQGRPSVVGYLDGRRVVHNHLQAARGAGSVVSTVRDIDRFYQALWNGDLLPSRVVDDMARSRGVVAPHVDYGLGLWRTAVTCGTGIGHSGAMEGFSIRARRLDGTESSVVVMVNDGDGQDIANFLADGVLCPEAAD
ncbi:MAG: serine hydrolase domain-containing protein [Nocardioides sp.]|uniref:serine hydrolase domain-containing protein n=1 Tax=Nocardioides sp. TaxID=35761 RepID=UPI003265F208